MTADDLLAEVEPLTHGARMRRMVDLGRAGRDDPKLAAILTELGKRGFYERYLALISCYGSHDGAHVLRALADPSRTMRRLAIALVPLVCDDVQALDALDLLQMPDRRRLAKRLRRRHRLGPLDALVGRLATRDDFALRDVLPYASGEAIALHIERVQDAASIHFWTRLARQHPDVAAQTLAARASTAADEAPRLVWQANAALPALAEGRPAAALALVDALSAHVPPHRLVLDAILKRRPAPIIDLILRADESGWLALDPVVPRLDAPRLAALLERLPDAHGAVQRRFRFLHPDVRAALFDAFGTGWRDDRGCVGIEILHELPARLRVPEARRHLSLPSLATRPEQRLRYAGLLPWDEALALLEPYLGSPDPDLRGAALPALAATVRYERDRAGELLALARARRNEQDPVRLALLAGLAGLPPGTWQAEHLTGLGAVIRDALDAADLSPATAAQVGRLVAAVLPIHPVWAADWMVTVARERGYMPVDNLQARLTDADVGRIAPVLLPVLASWAAREREPHVLSLAVSLGRRLRLVDGLGEILARLAHTTRSSWHAERALGLLRRHQPARFAALVPELLKGDESVVTLGAVWSYLHRRRQDLLGPYLGQRTYAGRFATGHTRIVLPFASGFERWTPAQREIFAATLREMTRRNPTTQDTPTILRGIAQLAAMQGVNTSELVHLTRRPHNAVRDTALRALGKLDDTTDAVPALLEAMDDDRARVAVYALRRALLALPPDRAIALLRAVPLDRVTVAKEVVRLYGDLRGPGAFAELEALGERLLHRDVRVALLRALWGHLDRPAAWTMLEEAASSPDPTLARSVMRTPADGLSVDGRRRLVALLGRLLEHPDATVRLAVAERCKELPVADPDRQLLARLLGRLGSPLPDECAAAVSAIFAVCRERDAASIGTATTALLLDRRALVAIVQGLTTAAPGARVRLLPVVRAVLAALANDRLTVSLQMRLATEALPWDELGDRFMQLADEGLVHSDALTSACAALMAAARRPDAVGLDALERRLYSSDDRYVRRLGLAALIGASQPPRGWNVQRLARLNVYRTDPAPLVAAAAQFTLPHEELEQA